MPEQFSKEALAQLEKDIGPDDSIDEKVVQHFVLSCVCSSVICHSLCRLRSYILHWLSFVLLLLAS